MVVVSHEAPFSMKTLIGVILLFGIGVATGVAVTLMMLAHGVSVPGAVLGSCLDGYGAWFVFFGSANLVRRVRKCAAET